MSHKENSENLPDDPLDRESPQGSECSSGYGSYRSNRSKDNDHDFKSHPESFINTYEKLIQSQKEVLRQKEDLLRQQEAIRQREDLLRQQEAIRQKEDLLRKREDSIRQREDSLCQQEAQRKINAVGDEQHLNCGRTHSCELKRSKHKEEQSENEDLQQRLSETNEELEKTRNALFDKDEELKSLYNRLAADVASSIKTGKAVNLNNPVSKPRIIELYEDLRWKWPKIKSSLKSKGGNENSSKIRKLIEKVFNNARDEMEKNMKKIDDVFEPNKARSDTEHSKVKEYRQLTIQNLQLAIFREKQDLKNLSPLHQWKTLQDVVDYLRGECFWLGRLMALNDPPLEPDWDSPPTTYDKWDILPHNIIESPRDQKKISKV